MTPRPTLLALFGLCLLAAPAAAQNAGALPANCNRGSDDDERPRRPMAPRDSARYLTQSAIRKDLADDLGASARAAGVEPRGIFLLLAERDGSNPTFRTFDSNVPDSVAAAVVGRIAPRLREWGERERIRLNLRIDSAGLPDSAAGPVVECRPVLHNRAEISRLLSEFATSRQQMLPPAGMQRTGRLRILVSREGRGVFAEIDRPSGDPGQDEFVLSLVPRMRFVPASLDGKGVDVWVTLPTGIAAAPEPRRTDGGRGIP